MRRVYGSKKSGKRVALEKAVLKQMQDARAALSPETLHKLQSAAFQMKEREEGAAVQVYYVDRRKTYETVLKFMTLRNFSRDFMKEVEALLSEARPH